MVAEGLGEGDPVGEVVDVMEDDSEGEEEEEGEGVCECDGEGVAEDEGDVDGDVEGEGEADPVRQRTSLQVWPPNRIS